MRKILLVSAALLLVAAAPSATMAQQAKGGPEFVRDFASQILVPFQSIGRSAQPAAPAKAKKAKRKKGKARARGKKPRGSKKKT